MEGVGMVWGGCLEGVGKLPVRCGEAISRIWEAVWLV